MVTRIECDGCDKNITSDTRASKGLTITIGKGPQDENPVASQHADLCESCLKQALRDLDFKSKARCKPDDVRKAC